MTSAVLAWLMNSIIEVELIPTRYKRGLLVPLPKPNKDHTVRDNNRGITLLPVFYKLLENALMQRKSEWLTDTDVTYYLQGAGQENCSGGHCLYCE